jgi:hypothetical protein
MTRFWPPEVGCSAGDPSAETPIAPSETAATQTDSRFIDSSGRSQFAIRVGALTLSPFRFVATSSRSLGFVPSGSTYVSWY